MNIVIWLQLNQNGGGIGLLNPALNILAQLYGGVNVLGLIAPQGITFNGVKNISKEDLKNLDYDLILVTGQNTSLVPILKDAETLDIDEDKIVLDRTVTIPNFTLEKYSKLRRSKLSIIPMNCLGVFIYNRLGLPFLSPIINMNTSEEDFLKFLKDPIKNVEKELIFKKMELTEESKFPIFMLGDIQWNMLHYTDKNVAFQKWHERRYRINWLNIIAMMKTERPEILAEFDKLPYGKKVCFVDFESDLDCAFYVKPEFFGSTDFWKIIYWWGYSIHYDFWDMLLYGKKTPLIFKNK